MRVRQPFKDSGRVVQADGPANAKAEKSPVFQDLEGGQWGWNE